MRDLEYKEGETVSFILKSHSYNPKGKPIDTKKKNARDIEVIGEITSIKDMGATVLMFNKKGEPVEKFVLFSKLSKVNNGQA